MPLKPGHGLLLSFPKKSGSKPSGDGGDKSPLMAQKNEFSVFWIKREGLAVGPDQE